MPLLPVPQAVRAPLRHHQHQDRGRGDRGRGRDHLVLRLAPGRTRLYSVCGCLPFWRSLSDDEMPILAASIDELSGFRLRGQIFVDDKGDYYEITDGLAQCAGYDTPAAPSRGSIAMRA
jgi:hypothetical protein